MLAAADPEPAVPGTGRGSPRRFAIRFTAAIAVSPIGIRARASGKSPSSSSSSREHESIVAIERLWSARPHFTAVVR